MGIRLYNPAIFQGSLKRKNYFEGWYFKLVAGNLSHTLAVIPGVSLVESDPHAFIQVIDGSSAYPDYARYPLDQFGWGTKNFQIKIGESVFTDSGLVLDIKTARTSLKGKVEFDNVIKYPRSVFSPGIMGWYSFVPFMECNHGIVSVNHDLKGNVTLSGNLIDLSGGKGYIEKDWGTSFPESWIWIQSNNFEEHDVSFMLSIAKIPWMGRFFTGLISFLYFNNQFYLFSTYNGSSFSEVRNDNDRLDVTLKSKRNKLKIRVIKNSFRDLAAPVQGEMSRRIKESVDSELQIELFNNTGGTIYTGTGRKVGLEIIDEIFKLF